MKLIRNSIFALLLCLLCLLILRSAQPLRDPGRLWVGGEELTWGGEASVGGGSAVYDAETRTLTLTDAVISGDFRGAAIYAEGDLTLFLAGNSRVEGADSGCTVLGDLTVSGQGTLLLSVVPDLLAFADDHIDDPFMKRQRQIRSPVHARMLLRVSCGVLEHDRALPFIIIVILDAKQR